MLLLFSSASLTAMKISATALACSGLSFFLTSSHLSFLRSVKKENDVFIVPNSPQRYNWFVSFTWSHLSVSFSQQFFCDIYVRHSQLLSYWVVFNILELVNLKTSFRRNDLLVSETLFSKTVHMKEGTGLEQIEILNFSCWCLSGILSVMINFKIDFPLGFDVVLLISFHKIDKTEKNGSQKAENIGIRHMTSSSSLYPLNLCKKLSSDVKMKSLTQPNLVKNNFAQTAQVNDMLRTFNLGVCLWSLNFLKTFNSYLPLNIHHLIYSTRFQSSRPYNA